MTKQTSSSRRGLLVPMALALSAGLILVGCGGDDGASSDTTAGSTTSTAAADSAAEGITVEGAWARTSPSKVTAGAVYMVITNTTSTDDALVGVSVDPSVARTAELHETSMSDDSGMDDSDMSDSGMDDSGMSDSSETTTTMAGDGGGMMTMKQVEEIPVPADGSVALEPGGYHVMLLDLVAPLEVGEKIQVTLDFSGAGEVVVEAEVRDTAP